MRILSQKYQKLSYNFIPILNSVLKINQIHIIFVHKNNALLSIILGVEIYQLEKLLLLE